MSCSSVSSLLDVRLKSMLYDDRFQSLEFFIYGWNLFLQCSVFFLQRFVQHCNWSPTVNDPQTENDPQNRPQMILDRKWSREENQNGLDLKVTEVIVSHLLSQLKVFIKMNKLNK